MTDEAIEGEVIVIIEQQEMNDPEGLLVYQAASREQMARRGGRLVARGGIIVEGEPALLNQLVLRWPSAKAFLDWQQSEEYRPLKDAREKFMKLRITMLPAS